MNIRNVMLKQKIITSIRAFLCGQGFIEVFPTRIGKHSLVNSFMDIGGLFDFSYYNQIYYLSNTAQSILEMYASEVEKCFSIIPCYSKEEKRDPQNLSEYWSVEAEWRNGTCNDIIQWIQGMLTAIYNGLKDDAEKNNWNLNWLNGPFDVITDGNNTKNLLNPTFIINPPINKGDWTSCKLKMDPCLCENVELVYQLVREDKTELLSLLSGGVRNNNSSDRQKRFSEEYRYINGDRNQINISNDNERSQLEDAFQLYQKFKRKYNNATCGFGMGIERLMMCIASSSDISEVCDFEDLELIRQFRN